MDFIQSTGRTSGEVLTSHLTIFERTNRRRKGYPFESPTKHVEGSIAEIDTAKHLEKALDAEKRDEKNFHIRQALQLIEMGVSE